MVPPAHALVLASSQGFALPHVSTLVNLPVMALFLVLQRRFIAGLTAGSLRG
jgi:ABC-type maltose transport system permease subunit